jgi:CelD/BcsL family acetyltransferase involved in cellulose biosynthesis
MGFDPQFAAVSPGFVLLWFALERLFDIGEFRRLDLGEGEYPYKTHLATSGVQVAEVYCFPWSFRNAAFVLMHSAVGETAKLLRTALEFLGLAQHLRKLLHYGGSRVTPPATIPGDTGTRSS